MTDSWPSPSPGAYWVQPGRLLAGPYPYRPRAAALNRLDDLLAAGVTCFVNLTEPHELPPYDEALPPGVIQRRHAIEDFSVPSIDQMIATLDTIDAALANGHTVYVHCWGGIGRTGTVMGCWLVRHGLSGQAALDELARRRGGQTNSPETDEQRAFVRTWPEIEPPASA